MSFSVLRKVFLSCFVNFLIFPFAATIAFGQVNEIETSYEKYNQYNLNEKIYLHTDRSFYICGNILWFKAYLTIASDSNKPLSASKIMYVEVLNTRQQPVLQGKIGIENGLGSGSFLLPFSLSSGNYEVRAYTNWMKNFSPDHYFRKNITIINTTKNLDTSAIQGSIKYEAAFFPEGGNLVNGLESKIAFKVIDNKNKDVDCNGVIINQSNDTSVHFKTFRLGMGHFYFTPEKGKEYIAVINCKDGTVIRKNLPKAYDAGYIMHVADSGRNDLKISVAINGLEEHASREIYIIIQNSGHINFARSQSIENGVAVLMLNKDSLKDGVSLLTVFDADKQPRCERLYFKRPKNQLTVTAVADKKSYKLRDKILINVLATNEAKHLLVGNLSASVFLLDSLHHVDEENIFSYFWLSSGLRGTIESPAYYISDEKAETKEALDNLLLAQGWRKFDWDKVMQNKTPSFTYVPENGGHIITGRITNELTKRPAPGVLVYFSVPGRRVQLKGSISDSAGIIHYDMKDFLGSSQIVLQTNTNEDSMYRMEIFSPFSEEHADELMPSLNVSERDADDLQKKNFHMEVENGYHKNDLQQLQNPLIDSLPFYYKPFKTYLLDNYRRFTTMEEVLREYVNEISVRRNGDNYHLMAFNAPALRLQTKQPVELMFKDNPLVLLDGVPVFKINKIITYDPLKVQKIEVVASKYYWGPITADGIASFTTYKGNLEGYTLDPNDLVLDYEGLQEQRVFYSPDYSSYKTFQSRLPDYRELLYWSPEIKTAENGKESFSFYSGDIPGKYVVVLQGLSSNGAAGSTNLILNVDK